MFAYTVVQYNRCIAAFTSKDEAERWAQHYANTYTLDLSLVPPRSYRPPVSVLILTEWQHGQPTRSKKIPISPGRDEGEGDEEAYDPFV